MKKRALKAIVFTLFAIVMLRACMLEYYCNIVDTIPDEIKERIIHEHPECVEIKNLAEFWIEHGDSLVSEIAMEQEYELELAKRYESIHVVCR